MSSSLRLISTLPQLSYRYTDSYQYTQLSVHCHDYLIGTLTQLSYRYTDSYQYTVTFILRTKSSV
jgi:hypothetical protein